LRCWATISPIPRSRRAADGRGEHLGNAEAGEDAFAIGWFAALIPGKDQLEELVVGELLVAGFAEALAEALAMAVEMGSPHFFVESPSWSVKPSEEEPFGDNVKISCRFGDTDRMLYGPTASGRG